MFNRLAATLVPGVTTGTKVLVGSLFGTSFSWLSQPAESGHDFFGAETHGVQDFFLGETAGGDIEHELLRADGIHVITDSLDTFVRSPPYRDDARRLFRHSSARFFGLG